jgi:hypothetical protein
MLISFHFFSSQCEMRVYVFNRMRVAKNTRVKWRKAEVRYQFWHMSAVFIIESKTNLYLIIITTKNLPKPHKEDTNSYSQLKYHQKFTKLCTLPLF